ncbi:AraC family transcriptional regulator [Agilicoccus flavus]|uniref:AraC family transcriptional regulator n=1 Tax=Agilicoccus flavus TaxID=2775968 RepID=UPI001CF71225|nr:AraC family transcriptional regulator [Agilicoccus flavus]
MARRDAGSAFTPALRAALPEAMLTLVDELTTTMFCVKDADGRYVAVNPTFVRRTNESSARAVLGRSASELFVPELAARYEEQDDLVLRTGATLRNELELIAPPGGSPRWYLTAKVPLRGPADAETRQDRRRPPGPPPVIGLVSLSQDLGSGDEEAMHALTRVVEHIDDHLGETIRVPDLAAVAGCSVDTLERRVRRAFRRTPGQLVLTARIDRARELLRGDDPLAEVALACGFYDQAAFSRTFARLAGQTPAAYRRAALTGSAEPRPSGERRRAREPQ